LSPRCGAGTTRITFSILETCVVRRPLTLLMAFLLAFVVASAAIFRPDRAALILAATVAHNVCAKTFVSGFDPGVAFAEITDQSMFLLWRPVMHYQLEHLSDDYRLSRLA
jgi:hypothetical protein